MILGYSNHAIMQFGGTALFDGTGPSCLINKRIPITNK